jgi:cytochrome P450
MANASRAARTYPPGPKISSLSALRQFRRDPIRLLGRAAAFGDVSFLQLPRFPAYLLNHPDLVREVLVTGSRDFMKGPTMQAAKLVLGESLLTSEGETHMRSRRLIQPIFHHDRIAAYGGAMVEHALRTSDRWRDGQSLDVFREMGALTLSIVGATLFGTDVEAEDARAVREALELQLSLFGRVFSPFFRLSLRLPLPSNRRFERSKAVLDGVIQKMIGERRSAGAHGDDVLSLLIRAREDGTGMTDTQVRHEALTLFLAGHETTAAALTWTWYLLSRSPGVESTLHAELETVLGGRAPTVEDLERLPYAQMVFTESLRLFPPAWAIGRRALTEHRIGEHAIPAGAVVIVSPYLIHRDPRWYEDPQTFAPERWAGDGREPPPRSSYLPFGAGPRMCVGEPFARLEGVLVLAAIAQRWRIHAPDRPVELQPVVTLRPRRGMPVTLERRA